MKNKYFESKDSLFQNFNSQKTFAIIVLMNKYFWKTKIAPIISLVIPFVFMLIFFAISNASPEASAGKPPTSMIEALPSFISMTILPLLLLTLPQMHVDFRNSILLRKIKISEIGKFYYIFLISSFFTIMSILFLGVTFIMFIGFANKELDQLKNIDWLGLFFSLIAFIFTCISLGFLLGVLTKKPLVALLSGFGIYILSQSLAGHLIPIYVISKIDFLEYIILFSPINYSLSLLNNAIIPLANYGPPSSLEISNALFISSSVQLPEFIGFEKNNIFDLTKPFRINDPMERGAPVTIIETWQKGLNIFMPFVLTISFTLINAKFFKWTSR